MSLVRLQEVAKSFGEVLAVDGVSFSIDRGEVVGFLGPNGAGKTTTIRLLTGFLRPTTGRVQLFGHDMSRPPQARPALARLGFAPDSAGLDPGATGRRRRRCRCRHH